MAYKFQLGDAVMSGSLIQEGTLEIMDDEGSMRFSVDRDNGLVSGSGNLRVVGSAHLKSTLNVSGAVLAGAGLTSTAAANSFGATSFGDANITNVGSIALDTITADDGASFAMGSNWTNAGRTVADAGILTTVDINGGSVDGATIGAAAQSSGKFTTLSASGDLNIADNVTVNGTARIYGAITADTGLNGPVGASTQAAGKFTTLSASGDLSIADNATVNLTTTLHGLVTANAGVKSTYFSGSGGVNYLYATQFKSTVAVSGTMTAKAINASSLSASGDLNIADNATVNGTVGVYGLLTAHGGASMGDANITNVGDIALDTISADGASFSFGSNWTAASRTCANLGTVTTADINGGSIDGTTIGVASQASVQATTLSASSTLDVVGNATVHGAASFSGSTIRFYGLANDTDFAVASDSLFYYDAGSKSMKQMLSSEYLKDIAGAGLSESGGKLTTDVSSGVIRWGNAAITLQEGFNVATASFSANRTWTLPGSPDISDVVRVKKEDSTYVLTIAGAGSQMIDGQASLLLESPSGSVSLICVATDRWSVY
jgi:hypothetical protein